jgi:hypothetical protein
MKYIINKKKQGSKNGNNYEVHVSNNCEHLPLIDNRVSLGDFNNCDDALSYAKKRYPSKSSEIDGCYYCCYSCHIG